MNLKLTVISETYIGASVEDDKVDCLHTPTVFWQGEGTIPFSYLNVHGVNDVRQTEIHTTEPLVPELSECL